MSEPILNVSMRCEKVASGGVAPNVNVGPDHLPQWALDKGQEKGIAYCWSCLCRHKNKQKYYAIDYCPKQRLLKAGGLWIFNPNANMRKYLLAKNKADWPKVTMICKKAYKVSYRPSVEIDYR